MHQTTSQERQFAWAGHAETTKGKQVLCRKTHTTLSTHRVFSDPIQSDFALHAWIQWILLSKFAFVCSEKVWSLKVFARLFEAGGREGRALALSRAKTKVDLSRDRFYWKLHLKQSAVLQCVRRPPAFASSSMPQCCIQTFLSFITLYFPPMKSINDSWIE